MHGTLATSQGAVAPDQRRQWRPHQEIMARNIEIKARVEHMATLVARAAAIADQGPVELQQDDTFFVCPSGRLKLRSFATGEGELIFYRRADQPGPKESFYLRSPIPTPPHGVFCGTHTQPSRPGAGPGRVPGTGSGAGGG